MQPYRWRTDRKRRFARHSPRGRPPTTTPQLAVDREPPDQIPYGGQAKVRLRQESLHQCSTILRWLARSPRSASQPVPAKTSMSCSNHSSSGRIASSTASEKLQLQPAPVAQKEHLSGTSTYPLRPIIWCGNGKTQREIAPVPKFPFLTSPTETAVWEVVLQDAVGDSTIAHQEQVVTVVVDTLGAGDAFFAASLVAHLNGKYAGLSLMANAVFAAQLRGMQGALGHARQEDLANGCSRPSINGQHRSP